MYINLMYIKNFKLFSKLYLIYNMKSNGNLINQWFNKKQTIKFINNFMQIIKNCLKDY